MIIGQKKIKTNAAKNLSANQVPDCADNRIFYYRMKHYRFEESLAAFPTQYNLCPVRINSSPWEIAIEERS